MPLIVIELEKGKRQNSRTMEAKGAKAPHNPFARYDRQLRQWMDKYLAPTTDDILRDYAGGMTPDEIKAIMKRLDANTGDRLAEVALRDLRVWIADIDGYSKKRFEDSIKRTMGIDAKSVLDPVLADEVRLEAFRENVELIKKLPKDLYFGTKDKDGNPKNDGIFDAIVADYNGDGFADGSKSLAGRIQNIIGSNKARASFIARDQTAKLNSVLAQAHQEDAGITHYVWRTAGDRRVVGTPGGLYPEGSLGHENHYARDGKIYAWSKPPVDGHPGVPYNCRCIAAPVINPAELRAVDLATGSTRYRETG